MSKEVVLAPKPDDNLDVRRINDAIGRALPLLGREANKSPWLIATTPVVENISTGRSLHLTSKGEWFWEDTSRSFDTGNSLDDALVFFARVFFHLPIEKESEFLNNNRKKLTRALADALEAAVQNCQQKANPQFNTQLFIV